MLTAPHAIIVTSCTNRKKSTGEEIALVPAPGVNSIEALCSGWKKQVAQAKCQLPASTLYQGRSFTEAKAAAAEANAPLFIASAGHGIVSSDKPLPSYNLTVAPNASNELTSALLRLGGTASDWWRCLTRDTGSHRSLSTLVREVGPSCTVILALPSTYVEMLSGDLTALTKDEVLQLRIISSELGIKLLPQHLQSQAIPYDERLEGLELFAGTRNDFPQRALRHFIAELAGHSLPLDVAKQLVCEVMSSLTKPEAPKREKRTDEEVEQLIRLYLSQFGNSQSAMLRWLRDDRKISCEQGRFRQLWHNVQAKLTTTQKKLDGKK